jgi:hypothetical protein
MSDSDFPRAADPAAVGNVALMLTTHLMAFLLKHGRLNQQEVAEIFRDTRMRYTTLPVTQIPEDGWGQQTTAILALAHNDVLRFGGP